MELREARQLVIQAGHELVESGLIARTWGNVSCRVSEDTFVITPSGRNYLSLTEEEIVLVRSDDLSCEGTVKPSSEKRIHAAVYRLEPHTNFIIHTHQENACVLSALGLSSIPISDGYGALGSFVPCAAYAMPGTQALCDHTLEALRRAEGHAVILEHHGALCTGADYEEAFRASSQLEDACGEYLKELFAQYSLESMRAPAGERSGRPFCESRRSSDGYVLLPRCGNGRVSDGEPEEIPVRLGEFLPSYENECRIYNEIYRAHPEISYILVADDEYTAWCSRRSRPLKTYLDDFAQMVGPKARVLPLEPKAISRALSHASAVLLQGIGALCCGKNMGDASAVRQICEKNCRTCQAGTISKQLKTVKPLEAAVMRRIYLKKYSKKF